MSGCCPKYENSELVPALGTPTTRRFGSILLMVILRAEEAVHDVILP
jgi:hypothetical protein